MVSSLCMCSPLDHTYSCLYADCLMSLFVVQSLTAAAAAGAAAGAVAGAAAARAAAEGAGATAGATAAAAAAGATAGAAAGATAAAAAAAGAAAPAAGASASDIAGADPAGAAATAAMRQPAASQPAVDAGIPAAPAAAAAGAGGGGTGAANGTATPAPMQPAQAGNLVYNMPTTVEFLVRELTDIGYIVMDDSAIMSIAPSLLNQVVALRTQGCAAQVVFKRSDVGVAAVASVLSIATGMMSVYRITDAAGTRYVHVPQLVPQPNITLAPGSLESYCMRIGVAVGMT